MTLYRGITPKITFQTVKIPARDGYLLTGTFYQPAGSIKGVILLESAMTIGRNYYTKFARWMAQQGFAVLTYDHRGTGESRPAQMRGFEAGLSQWVQYDCFGAAEWLAERWHPLPMGFLGHSVGGMYVGFMENNHLFQSVVTIGGHTAYYKDWELSQRSRHLAFLHGFVPLLTQIAGYFPGRLFGLQDVPAGVVRDLQQRRKESDPRVVSRELSIPFYFDQIDGKILALGFTDDPIGTPAALSRLNRLFSRAMVETRIISPNEVADFQIGHHEFFRRRNRTLLWPLVSQWFNRTLLQAEDLFSKSFAVLQA